MPRRHDDVLPGRNVGAISPRIHPNIPSDAEK